MSVSVGDFSRRSLLCTALTRTGQCRIGAMFLLCTALTRTGPVHNRNHVPIMHWSHITTLLIARCARASRPPDKGSSPAQPASQDHEPHVLRSTIHFMLCTYYKLVSVAVHWSTLELVHGMSVGEAARPCGGCCSTKTKTLSIPSGY